MNDTSSERIELPAAEAACLAALRSGAAGKSRVAVATGLHPGAADRSLQQLSEKGLAVSTQGRWRLTAKGEMAAATACRPELFEGVRQPRPDSSADRLLQCLDRPKRGTEIAAELGISRESAIQRIVRLLARGLLRPADREWPTWFVARIDDPTRLLRRREARILSALPEDAPTTLRNLGRRLKLESAAIQKEVAGLAAGGLLDIEGSGEGSLVRVTTAGVAHPQRDPAVRRAGTATPPAPPFKSDRVLAVLDLLADEPARASAVGRKLGIERSSINALFQYLKRRGLLQKAGTAQTAPHELSAEGRRVLDEMSRAAAGVPERRP